jgi:hypothetical protein
MEALGNLAWIAVAAGAFALVLLVWGWLSQSSSIRRTAGDTDA